MAEWGRRHLDRDQLAVDRLDRQRRRESRDLAGPAPRREDHRTCLDRVAIVEEHTQPTRPRLE
jgi:hypothetical protein